MRREQNPDRNRNDAAERHARAARAYLTALPFVRTFGKGRASVRKLTARQAAKARAACGLTDTGWNSVVDWWVRHGLARRAHADVVIERVERETGRHEVVPTFVLEAMTGAHPRCASAHPNTGSDLRERTSNGINVVDQSVEAVADDFVLTLGGFSGQDLKRALDDPSVRAFIENHLGSKGGG